MIYIKEIFPNPIGQDAGNEWIKLFNDSDSDTSLLGWFIKDESGKSLQLDNLKSAPHGDFKISLPKGNIILNNDKDTVFLYDRNGNLVSKLGYNSSAEDEIIVSRELQSSKTVPPFGQIAEPATNNIIPNHQLNPAPFVIGFVLALFMGVAAGLLIKRWQIAISNE